MTIDKVTMEMSASGFPPAQTLYLAPRILQMLLAGQPNGVATLDGEGKLANPAFQRSGSGSVLRTAQQRFEEGAIFVGDKGALLDGTTDDTGALISALATAAASSDKRAVWVQGSLLFDPSSVTLPSYTALFVDGVLKPQGASIQLPSHTSIIGVSGPTSGQFQRGQAAAILSPGTGIPTIKVSGSANHSLKNLVLKSGFGMRAGGVAGINALLTMDNVTVEAFQDNAIALHLDNFFWLWANNCVLLTASNGYRSVYVKNTSRSNAQDGLYFFDGLITSGKGVRVDAPDLGGPASNMHFRDWEHENLPSGDTVLEVKGGNILDVNITNYGNSDPVGTAYDFDVDGARSMTIRGVKANIVWKSYPSNSVHLEVADRYDYTKTAIDVAADQVNRHIHYAGDIDVRSVSRATAGEPTLVLGTGAELTPASAGSVTVTGTQLAPDGSSTAYLIEVPTGSGSAEYSITLLNANLDLDGGDFLLHGGWFRAATLTEDISGFVTGQMMLASVTSPQGITASSSSLRGRAFKWKNVGWLPLYGIMPISGTKTGNSGTQIALRSVQGRNYYVWKPWYRIIDASLGFDQGTLLKYLNRIGAMPGSAKHGVVALHAHQTMRTGLGVTGSRPSASAVGAGAQWFDTTLNKPIWSTGSAWVDAAGSSV